MYLQALLLSLVAGEFVDEFAEFRRTFCDVTAFVVAFEAAGDLVEESADDGEVGVSDLGVEFVGGVELDSPFQALLWWCSGGLLWSWGWADDRRIHFGLVVLDAE